MSASVQLTSFCCDNLSWCNLQTQSSCFKWNHFESLVYRLAAKVSSYLDLMALVERPEWKMCGTTYMYIYHKVSQYVLCVSEDVW